MRDQDVPETAAQASGRRRRWRLRLTRDMVLFGCGLAGVAHETLFTSIDRPDLLILFAAMIGLPIYLRKNGV